MCHLIADVCVLCYRAARKSVACAFSGTISAMNPRADDSAFDSWNRLKKRIHSDGLRAGLKEREIWYLKMGKNVGYEQDGKGGNFLRPVLIFRKFNNEVFLGLPLTGQHKPGPYYHNIPDIRARKNSIMLSQLRLYDAKRLSHHITTLPDKIYLETKQKLQKLVVEAGLRIETPRTRRGSARRRLYQKHNK